MGVRLKVAFWLFASSVLGGLCVQFVMLRIGNPTYHCSAAESVAASEKLLGEDVTYVAGKISDIPLGVQCQYEGASGASVLVNPNWVLTVLVILSVLAALAGLVLFAIEHVKKVRRAKKSAKVG